MLLGVFALIFCLGLREIVCLHRCPSLRAPRRGSVACFLGNESLSCASGPPALAIAVFTCREFYKMSTKERRVVKCLPNGSWTSPPPKCIPDCGRKSSSVSLILNGELSTRGAYPWHVALYYSLDGVYEYWCGGSLVSETAVITAAHCVWEVSPEKLMMAVGKFHREYNSEENFVQKVRAWRIKILKSYQDVSGNYNGDIAVVFLERAVSLEYNAVPVCLDLNQELMEQQLAEQSTGVAVGWGKTENDALSDYLRVVRLPVVSDEKCIAEQEQDFKKFITYTSFCAGYKNGTAVCNGDSGGGMTFFDKDSARWYLQGVVSVSPRKRGTPYCDPHFYTVFTKVSVFSKWFKGMKEFTEVVAAYESLLEESRNKLPLTKEKRIVFPHTKALLKLAGFSAFPQNSSSALVQNSVEDSLTGHYNGN